LSRSLAVRSRMSTLINLRTLPARKYLIFKDKRELHDGPFSWAAGSLMLS
jgi:hypothetical protein